MSTIYVYRDETALEDGVLVAVGRVDRVTRSLWDFMVKNLQDQPPECWPVHLLGYIHGDRAMAAAQGLIAEYRDMARKVYEDNIGGGIWEGYIQLEGESIKGFSRDNVGDTRKVWLMPNEIGGMTLMFPGDY